MPAFPSSVHTISLSVFLSALFCLSLSLPPSPRAVLPSCALVLRLACSGDPPEQPSPPAGEWRPLPRWLGRDLHPRSRAQLAGCASHARVCVAIPVLLFTCYMCTCVLQYCSRDLLNLCQRALMLFWLLMMAQHLTETNNVLYFL